VRLQRVMSRGVFFILLLAICQLSKVFGDGTLEQRFAIEGFCPTGKPSGIFDTSVDLGWVNKFKFM
jgi:hypothetical protein